MWRVAVSDGTDIEAQGTCVIAYRTKNDSAVETKNLSEVGMRKLMFLLLS
jgi:hypothetical protein